MHHIVFLAKVLPIVCNLAIVESTTYESEHHVCLQGSFLRFPSRHHFYRHIRPNIWGSPGIVVDDMLVDEE